MTLPERLLTHRLASYGVDPDVTRMILATLPTHTTGERCPVCGKRVQPRGPLVSRWCQECLSDETFSLDGLVK